MPQVRNVSFEVQVKTDNHFHTLVVCGAGASLGRWNPWRAPKLRRTSNESGVWRSEGTILVEFNDDGEAVFKFVKIHENCKEEWELNRSNGDRKLKLHLVGGMHDILVMAIFDKVDLQYSAASTAASPAVASTTSEGSMTTPAEVCPTRSSQRARSTTACAKPTRRVVQSFGCQIAWEHFDQKESRWIQFDPDAVEIVERAYSRGAECVRFKACQAGVGREYDLNFDTNIQHLTANPTLTRRVRRVHLPPPELTSIRHPAVVRLTVAFGTSGGLPPYLPEDVYSRFDALAELYTKILNEARRMAPVDLPLPRWRGVEQADACAVVAAVSLALLRLYPLEIRFAAPITLCYCWGSEGFDGFRKAIQEEQERVKAPPQPLLAQRGRSFEWLRKETGLDSKRMRLTAACASLAAQVPAAGFGAVACGGVPMPKHIREMVEGTAHVCWTARYPVQPRDGVAGTAVHRGAQTVLEEALQVLERRPGASVCVVSAANAFHLGGGFLSGGRHALEEAICMQTTVYHSLARAQQLALERGGRGLPTWEGRRAYILEDFCVLSPSVEVLRDGTDRGYKLRDSAALLAGVVSVAMPNKNPAVHDSPVDHRQGVEYTNLLARKFQAILRAAIRVKADVLVVPDIGCGVFRNDPEVVGKIFGRVLGGFDGCLEEVVLVGNPQFVEAAERAANRLCSPSLEGWRLAAQLKEVHAALQHQELQMQLHDHRRQLARLLELSNGDVQVVVNTFIDAIHEKEVVRQSAVDVSGLVSILQTTAIDRQQRPIVVVNSWQVTHMLSEISEKDRYVAAAIQFLCDDHRKRYPSWTSDIVLVIIAGDGPRGADSMPSASDTMACFGRVFQKVFPEAIHRLLVIGNPVGTPKYFASFKDGLSSCTAERIEELRHDEIDARLGEVTDDASGVLSKIPLE